MKKYKKIYIAGQEGMVGSAIYKLAKIKKFRIIECSRSALDLTNQKKVNNFIKKISPI